MSAFICSKCDNLRDSDDGCDAAPNGTDLICVECMTEEENDDAQDDTH